MRAAALAAVGAAAIAAGVVYAVHRTDTARPHPVVPLVAARGLVQRSGVRVVRVSVTGDGGLVDLRYQVLDPARAESLHAAATPPLLVDERTGGVLGQLLMGHFHHGTATLGRTYYLIFVDSGTIVRRGSRVTVQLGNARLAHVLVQ